MMNPANIVWLAAIEHAIALNELALAVRRNEAANDAAMIAVPEVTSSEDYEY